MMLKLSYNTVSDKHSYTTVISSPEGIRELLWQLTRNYSCNDGTKIDTIKVSNLEGFDISHEDCLYNPYTFCTN